jgi:predicted helicase
VDEVRGALFYSYRLQKKRNIGYNACVVWLLLASHITEESRSAIPMRVSKEFEEIIIQLASLTHHLRAAFAEALSGEARDGILLQLPYDLSQMLHCDLDAAQCVDIFAQMLTYGLFATRLRLPYATPLTRSMAVAMISDTIPPLHTMFSTMVQSELYEQFMPAIDQMIDLLNHMDSIALLQANESLAQSEDMLMHCYEQFLTAYNARERNLRGVFYTPAPVVSYIVSSVDALLKRDFAVARGLADNVTATLTVENGADQHCLKISRIQLLDPAAGTGAFLHALLDHMHASFKGNEQSWLDAVAQHRLPHLTSFELLPIPYLIAQMNLCMHLARFGCDQSRFPLLHLQRGNTLEERLDSARFPLAHLLTGECTGSDAAAPIMVIMGNPPYAGHSINNGTWIAELLHNAEDNYFTVDEEPLAEHNSKWLNDDYVKFVRFAQEYVRRVGCGIVAFVTNHGYLDNPTFRGMRLSLMRTFDELYLLDLHGNIKKKERTPDGSKDENVFDIQQGVAIGIFVKQRLPYSPLSVPSVRPGCAVYHADLWGPRVSCQKGDHSANGGKFSWLASHDVTTTAWTRLEPVAPLYLFVPRNDKLRAEYEQGWRIDQIMETFSLGILTKRDSLVIGFDREEVYRNIQAFADSMLSDSACAAQFGLPLRDKDRWNLAKARVSLSHDINESLITSIAYRPFDERAIYYDARLVARMNTRVMRHLKYANRALVLGRQGAATGSTTWDVAFVTTMLPDQNIFRRGGGSIFPLYLYADDEGDQQQGGRPNSSLTSSPVRRPNLSNAFIAALSKCLNQRFIADSTGDLRETFGPDDVFNYIYAVLFSPDYRSRYASFLKSDFPRLPLPVSQAQFRTLCQLGARLVRLHTLEKCGGAGRSMSSFPISGNNVVERVIFVEAATIPYAGEQTYHGSVYINRTQYFTHVPLDVWTFHVGGYPVCHKWLHDRKGRVLSQLEIRQFQRMIATLVETIAIMKEIQSVVAYHSPLAS